jgi:hypothetical protein
MPIQSKTIKLPKFPDAIVLRCFPSSLEIDLLKEKPQDLKEAC